MTNHENSKIDSNQDKTRLLLALWDLGGLEAGVNKGDLNKRIIRTNEKSSLYEPVLTALLEEGAIATAAKRSTKITLTELGFQTLVAGLASLDFKFDGNQVGTWVANALLKWIRQIGGAEPVAPSEVVESVESSENPDDLDEVEALEVEPVAV